MPYAIDEEKFSELKVLDMNAPPTKNIPYEAFPKMVYLHPKDKSKEHRTLIVHNDSELEAAIEQGYRTKPHIPTAPTEDLTEHFEAAKRGPGRPRSTEAA